MVVCPSGFWAYRHAVGVPSSDSPPIDVMTGDAGEVRSDTASHISFTGKPRMVIGEATSLTDHQQHVAVLQRSGYVNPEDIYDDRERLFVALDGAHPQVVYFYCHGGVSKGTPFLQIGPTNSKPITPQNVQVQFYWPDDRPLVFLNGCRTTALTPKDAYQFVSAFVGEPRACGVIGTEVTIVEDLAQPFAELFFEEFRPADGCSETVGEAIRLTRLRLLSRENPLGLVYSPFVMPDVRLVEHTTN
jgi:hypothetical protein